MFVVTVSRLLLLLGPCMHKGSITPCVTLQKLWALLLPPAFGTRGAAVTCTPEKGQWVWRVL